MASTPRTRRASSLYGPARLDQFNPMTLRFYDERAEIAYRDHYYTSRHELHDKHFAVINAIGAIFHITIQILGFVEVSFNAMLHTALYILVAAAHSSVLFQQRSYRPTNHRTFVTVLTRLTHVSICLLAMPHWVPVMAAPAGMQMTISGVVKQVLLGSGAMLGVWFQLGMPLLFRHAVLLGLLESLATSVMLANPVCTRVTLDQEGQKAINMLWEYLDFAARIAYEAHLPGSSQTRQPDSSSTCLSVAVFNQMFIGFLLPIVVLYIVEGSSREAFCASFFAQMLTEDMQFTGTEHGGSHTSQRGTIGNGGSEQMGHGGLGYGVNGNPAQGTDGGLVYQPLAAEVQGSAWPRYLVQLLCLLLGLAGTWELCNMAAGAAYPAFVSGKAVGIE